MEERRFEYIRITICKRMHIYFMHFYKIYIFHNCKERFYKTLNQKRNVQWRTDLRAQWGRRDWESSAERRTLHIAQKRTTRGELLCNRGCTTGGSAMT